MKAQSLEDGFKSNRIQIIKWGFVNISGKNKIK